jgi:hypothetical protein
VLLQTPQHPVLLNRVVHVRSIAPSIASAIVHFVTILSGGGRSILDAKRRLAENTDIKTLTVPE